MAPQSPPVRVSIVTPNRNGAAYLERTIRSVVQQTHPDIEYLLIDGASTDGSLDIIERWRDRIAYVRSQPDGGMYSAVNHGLRQATGDILAYLNSDDLYFPDTVAKVVEHFRRHPEVDLVYGDLTLIDADDRRLFDVRFPRFDSPQYCCVGHSLIGQPAAFWRRSLLDRIGLFDDSMRLAADHDFFARAGRAGRLLHVADRLAAFRVHPASLTSTQQQQSQREVALIRERYAPASAWLREWHAALGNLRFKAINLDSLPRKLALKATGRY